MNVLLIRGDGQKTREQKRGGKWQNTEAVKAKDGCGQELYYGLKDKHGTKSISQKSHLPLSLTANVLWDAAFQQKSSAPLHWCQYNSVS